MKIKIKTQQQCLLKLKIKSFLKVTIKYGKKIEELLGIKFNTKPTCGDDEKYIKTKIKSYENNVTTNLYHKKGYKNVSKEKIPHKFLSLIILDSILYAYEKYLPKIFLEECKYAEEKIKTKNYIDKELKSASDSKSDSDSESDSDTNNEEQI